MHCCFLAFDCSRWSEATCANWERAVDSHYLPAPTYCHHRHCCVFVLATVADAQPTFGCLESRKSCPFGPCHWIYCCYCLICCGWMECQWVETELVDCYSVIGVDERMPCWKATTIGSVTPPFSCYCEETCCKLLPKSFWAAFPKERTVFLGCRPPPRDSEML